MLKDERKPDAAKTGLGMVFRDLQDTPAMSVDLYTVELERVLTFPVSTLKTSVEIWVDPPEEPGTIRVIVGDGTLVRHSFDSFFSGRPQGGVDAKRGDNTALRTDRRQR